MHATSGLFSWSMEPLASASRQFAPDSEPLSPSFTLLRFFLSFVRERSGRKPPAERNAFYIIHTQAQRSARFLLGCANRGAYRHHTPGGLGFVDRTGQYRPGGSPVSSPVCWSCRCMEGFIIRGWDLILPGWRCVYEPQVGVATPCGAVSSRGTIVFVPGPSQLQI